MQFTCTRRSVSAGAPSGIGCDAALAAHELIDPLDRHVQVLRQSHPGEPEWLEELVAYDLAR